jgi:hypothetical protein
MKKIIFTLIACVAALIAFSGSANIAYADTVVGGGKVNDGTYWTAAGSPYIIEDGITVPSGSSLTIGPGVTIVTDPSLEGYDAFFIKGALNIEGTVGQPVSISGPGSIYIQGTSSIDYADISLSDGISISQTHVDIASSTISGASQAIHSRASTVNITGSRLADNQYGIYVEPTTQIMHPVESADPFSGTGGIGNALDDSDPPSVAIHNSVLVNNGRAAIKNTDTTMVDATDNWWGTGDGPLATTTNTVIGAVAYDPWLKEDPDKLTPVCCSNILFIPGLEGTRLYKPQSLPLSLLTSTNQLWEPNINADVTKLYLNPDGTSKDHSVYSGQPIDSALGLQGIYGKFMGFLDGLVSKGSVNEWRAFGYDWREPIAEVVAGSQKKATTTESLLDIVSRMASSSKTGKVTLIAHSNGGLVAKYLVKTLVDLGKDSLIDSVISVGVPYLGTPEAILGLLHGDHQSIFHGLITSQATARGLGVNMASAYSLLPSAEFFRSAFSPTIAFASTTVKGVNNGSYPRGISTAADQSAFITDANNARKSPDFTDTNSPIRGNKVLSTAALVLHDLLDPMAWPKSIATWAIVGWNAATTQSVTYHDSSVCAIQILGLICADKLAHDIVETNMGDGTVVAPSAAYNSSNTLAVDLKSASDEAGHSITHANILESSTTEAIVGLIVGGDSSSSSPDASAIVLAKTSQLPGVTVGIPDPSQEPMELRVSTHSPVELNVYDDKGNHTGPIPLPANLAGQDSYYTGAYETKIPDSDYQAYDSADGQDTYITLPSSGAAFKIVANGTDLGFATLDIERVRDSQVLDSVEYSQFPVTPLSTGSTTVSSALIQNDLVSLDKTPPLALDIDGDGTVDQSFKQNRGALPDPTTIASSTLKMMQSLAGSDPHGKQLIQRIKHLMDLMSKGKLKQVKKQSGSFDFHFGHLRFKGISVGNKQKILDNVETMVREMEEAQ